MEKSRILKSYHIQYLANGFIQKKYLVSKDDWDNIIKPIKKAITIIEDDNKGKENVQSKLLKDSLKIMYGDYTKCFPEKYAENQTIFQSFIAYNSCKS